MANTFISTISTLALVTLLAACAGGGDEHAQSGDTGGGGEDAGSEDTASDLAEQDAATQTDTGGGPDTPTQDLPDRELAGECEPFTAQCTEDLAGIQRCSGNGELFDPTPCAEDKVCVDDAGGPTCAECTAGVDCPSEAAFCEAGRPFCLDFETAAQCTAEGTLGNTSVCSPGRCFGGGCMTAGNPTGQACSQDSGCHGRRCLCGAEDTANSSTAVCSGNLAAGYCTTSSCRDNGCDPEEEVCADFTLSEAYGDDSFCVLKEDCSVRLGGCRTGSRGDDHVCRSLPSTNPDGSERTWELGCWVPPPSGDNSTCSSNDCMSPIGGACNANADCIGGLCLKQDGESYCSALCSEDIGCPDYAACVRMSDDSALYCLARANEDDCPRVASHFEIVATPLTTADGVTTSQVCFFRD